MNNRIIFTLILGGVVLTVALGIRYSRSSADSRDGIKISAVLPMTGAASVFGKYNCEVTKATLEILSKRLNVRYSLDVGDSKSTSKDAVAVFSKMKNFGDVPNVVGVELSAAATAIYPIASSAHSLLVAIATAEDLHNKNDAIQIYPSSGQIYDCLAKFKAEVDYDGAITLFYINDDFGQSVSRMFKSKDPVRYNCVPFDSTTDVKAIVAKNKGSFSFVCGYGSAFLALIRELQSGGASKYIVASPEFAFPEFYGAVNSHDTALYYMEFARYEALNVILSKSLGRSVNPLDFLVFGGYLSVFTVAHELNEKGLALSGDLMFNSIKCRTFSFDGFEVSFDQNGTALYDLRISRASKLSDRRQ